LVFFLAGEPHGTLSNATSLPGALTWLPIVLLLTLSDLTQPSPSRTVATAAGILGPTGISIVQSFLILKISSIWQQSALITSAVGHLGVWFILFSRDFVRIGVLSKALTGLGNGLGAAFALASLCILSGGFPPGTAEGSVTDMSQFNPLTAAGFALIFLGYFVQPVWALWLARRLPGRPAHKT
jgi:hypothetical protein